MAFVGGKCGVGVAVPAGGWTAPTTPGGPAQRDSPPAQGGTQILGSLPSLTVDVPVTMLDKIQQSMPEKLEVPQIQFLDRLVDIQLVCVGAAQCTLCTRPWSCTGPVPWYGVDVPVVVQQQVPWPTLLAHAWLDSGCIFCMKAVLRS